MHLMLSLEVGGMENGVVNTLRLINKDLFKPFVCCLETVGPLAKRLEGSDVKIINMSKKPGVSPSLALKLSALFKRLQIDILHTHCWATLLYGIAAAKIAGVPTIIHGEHGIFNLESRHRRYLYLRLIKSVDLILTVSESLKDELALYAKTDSLNLHTIINGVDTDKFYPQDSGVIKKRLGFEENDTIIGSVGRLEEVKNYKMLIKCVASFNEPSIKGLLIGDGPLRSELAALTKNLGIEHRFCFLGEKYNVHELICAMDIFVLSSLSEGLSNTILEAMASGLPVVATRVGGNSEIVYHGETGYLVKSDDLESMRAACKRMISDKGLAAFLGQTAREYVMNNHSIESMARKYETVYHELFKDQKQPMQ